MQVRAKIRGSYGLRMRQPGEVFEMDIAPGEKLPYWVQDASLPVTKPSDAPLAPLTLSELARAEFAAERKLAEAKSALPTAPEELLRALNPPVIGVTEAVAQKVAPSRRGK